MTITDPTLRRSIHNATGMSNDEMEADPAEYINRFIEAGLAIIDVRARMDGKPGQKGNEHG